MQQLLSPPFMSKTTVYSVAYRRDLWECRTIVEERASSVRLSNPVC